MSDSYNGLAYKAYYAGTMSDSYNGLAYKAYYAGTMSDSYNGLAYKAYYAGTMSDSYNGLAYYRNASELLCTHQRQTQQTVVRVQTTNGHVWRDMVTHSNLHPTSHAYFRTHSQDHPLFLSSYYTGQSLTQPASVPYTTTCMYT